MGVLNHGHSHRYILIFAWILSGLGGCSSVEVAPIGEPIPPPYTQVPHPEGLDLGDLNAIFLSPGAPKPEDYKTCDADYMKLKSLTASLDEINRGTKQLVKLEPVKYHWCFYVKMQALENKIKDTPFIDERQKQTLSAYEFLMPIAKAFSTEFNDTRYMRWAVSRYQHLSPRVFFRPLKLTPRMTVELVEPNRSFGLWRDPKPERDVLDKYQVGKNAVPSAILPTPVASPEPVAIASPLPATAPMVLSSPTPIAPPVAEAAPPVAVASPMPIAPAPVAEATPLPAPVPTADIAPGSGQAMEAPPLPPVADIPAGSGQLMEAPPLPVETQRTPASAPAPVAPPPPAAPAAPAASAGAPAPVVSID
jgi:cell fate (sporulation/competence/biofilm development) regulator YmcA (YheA/YmcA/DUF963 family)